MLTALGWALAIVLFKRAGASIGPTPLNLLKNSVGLTLVLLTGLCTGMTGSGLSYSDAAWLIGSGAVGVGIADLLVLYGLSVGSAGQQAIVEALYTPSVVVSSYFLLDERLSPQHAAGGLLVLGGVVLAKPASQRSPEHGALALRGMLAGAAAMVLMAVAIVAVKPMLERGEVLTCTSLRLLGGVLCTALLATLRGQLRRLLRDAYTPRPAFRTALPAAFIGTYLALMLWIAAFKLAPASIAALLSQTSSVFVVLFARPLLNEPLVPRMLLALALSLCGSAIVLLR